MFFPIVWWNIEDDLDRVILECIFCKQDTSIIAFRLQYIVPFISLQTSSNHLIFSIFLQRYISRTLTFLFSGNSYQPGIIYIKATRNEKFYTYCNILKIRLILEDLFFFNQHFLPALFYMFYYFYFFHTKIFYFLNIINPPSFNIIRIKTSIQRMILSISAAHHHFFLFLTFVL